MHVSASIDINLADLMLYLQRGDARVAMASYLVLTNLPARLKAVRSALQMICSGDQPKRFQEIAKSIEEATKGRNAVAHSRWAENGYFPDGLIRLPHPYENFGSKKQVELWCIEDFRGVSRKLQIANSQLSEFVHEVNEARK